MNQMTRLLAFIAVLALAGTAFSADSLIVDYLHNPTDVDWIDLPVAIPITPAQGKLQTAKTGDVSTFVQCDDLDGDGTADEAFFLAKIPAGKTAIYQLTSDKFPATPPSRAHAGMFLPSATTKGMEGPGWESDLIAFRLYWDARNATDVFCKTEPILSLEQFAAKGHDYHRQSKWGQDVLKVGTAVGIGGFGVLDNGVVCKVADAKREFKVRADGPLRAVCDLIYTDWTTSSGRKLELTAREFAYAGHDWGETELMLKATDGKPLLQPICGVVHHSNAEVFKSTAKAAAGTWGRQALGDNQVPNSANLGLAVAADPAAFDGFGQDKVNVYIKLKAPGGKARFRYTANWEKQKDAAKSVAEFQAQTEKMNALRPLIRIPGLATKNQ